MHLRHSLALSVFAAIGCSGGSGTDSTKPLPDGAPVTILVEFHTATGAGYLATLNGVTYTQSPGFVKVPSGTREISGTFTTTTLSVDFGGFVGDGGVPLNAVRNISGPNAVVDKCSVQYARTTGAGPSAFRMEFDVVTTPGAHC